LAGDEHYAAGGDEGIDAVEHGLIDERQFREFVFANPAMLHAGMNPDFYNGTVVERDVAALLGTA
jgi:hypothetical protein